MMSHRGIDLAVDEINRGWWNRWQAAQNLLSRDDQVGRLARGSIAQELVGESGAFWRSIGHVNSGAMLAASRIYDGQLSGSRDNCVISRPHRCIQVDLSRHLERFAQRRNPRAIRVADRRHRLVRLQAWASILYENDALRPRGRRMLSAGRFAAPWSASIR